jgi:succinyl-diaminopimelate desuccinylase
VNAINYGSEHDVLDAASEDHESVVALTRELVAIPAAAASTPASRCSTA